MKAVILAGGKGIRLWPESRSDKPKQLCSFFGNKSMLEHTIDRLDPDFTSETLIITVKDQEKMIREVMFEAGLHHRIKIICEPAGRNTAPAVGLALASCLDADPAEVMAIFPADHYIRDTRAYQDVLARAVESASRGYLTTVGIPPAYPETGYGYIHKGEKLPGLSDAYQVQAFKEKPDLATALTYLEAGSYFWNSGMFVARIDVWSEEYHKHLPRVYDFIMQGYEPYLSHYSVLPDISLDYAIAEKCRRVAMVRGDFGWSDVGSWKALAELLDTDQNGNVLVGDDILALGVKDCLVKQTDKTVALLEVDGLIVVETRDVIFICSKEKSQQVKKMVDLLVAEGRDVLL
ncbi:MAG: sugar phosphate nucleotidyltransferase [Syntrophomonas sp.]